MVQKLNIYTDHKNLTCKNFNTDKVLPHIIILEKCSLDTEYIPGNKNIDAYALSQLPNNVNQKTTHESTYLMEQSKLYDIKLTEGKFLLSFKRIDRYQWEYFILTEKLNSAKYEKFSPCRDRNTINLVTFKDEIVISQLLR